MYTKLGLSIVKYVYITVSCYERNMRILTNIEDITRHMQERENVKDVETVEKEVLVGYERVKENAQAFLDYRDSLKGLHLDTFAKKNLIRTENAVVDFVMQRIEPTKENITSYVNNRLGIVNVNNAEARVKAIQNILKDYANAPEPEPDKETMVGSISQ
jgi:hypothetical protein